MHKNLPLVHFFNRQRRIILILVHNERKARRILGYPNLLQVAKLSKRLLYIILSNALGQISYMHTA
jgi:hypothetical protein